MITFFNLFTYLVLSQIIYILRFSSRLTMAKSTTPKYSINFSINNFMVLSIFIVRSNVQIKMQLQMPLVIKHSQLETLGKTGYHKYHYHNTN